MRPDPSRCDIWGMRRIETMKTLNDQLEAIEEQLDEIQRTFGTRWEW
jgi:hypothetical protein